MKFSAAVAHFAPWRFNLTGIAEPEQVRGALVSPNFFSALGIAARRAERCFRMKMSRAKMPLWCERRSLDRLFGPAARLAGQSITLTVAHPPSWASCLQASAFPPRMSTCGYRSRSPATADREMLLFISSCA